MSEIVEYELPADCFRRLTQSDNSDKFNIIVKISSHSNKEVIIQTTQNKSRVISRKINEILQIDPTISKYELNVPDLITKCIEKEEEYESVKRDIEYLLKSTSEKLTISKEQLQRIQFVRHLLGERNDDDNCIKFDSINEAISYISTEFHDNSIKYLSSHMKDILNEGQIFHLTDTIINEIIDSYFIQVRDKGQRKTNQNNGEEEKELFEKLSKTGDTGNVMHFLLQCESFKYTKDMREYIISHLSDDIISNEMSHIVRQYLFLLAETEETKKKEGTTEIEFKDDELKGIISHLEEKCGANLCEKGELRISDIGTHHNVSGSLSNLIKYDNEHINDYYYNNGGSSPLPNSSSGWIEFDFLKRKIKLTSYTLRTSESIPNSSYHAKSWRIVGSNDCQNWEVINQQVNNASLNDRYRQHRFECAKNDKYYRYIRYIQDDSWSSNRKHNIFLTCVEFFGCIQENE